MPNKQFHYLVAKRDEIHAGDLGRLRKWKVSGDETLAEIFSILLSDYLPCNPPPRTELWILLSNGVELAAAQQNWEAAVIFAGADEKIKKYYDDKGDFVVYLKCLFTTSEKEKHFHDRGLQYDPSGRVKL